MITNMKYFQVQPHPRQTEVVNYQMFTLTGTESRYLLGHYFPHIYLVCIQLDSPAGIMLSCFTVSVKTAPGERVGKVQRLVTVLDVLLEAYLEIRYGSH